MNAPQARRLGVSDLMILILGFAFALYINKLSYQAMPALIDLFFYGGPHAILAPVGLVLPHASCLALATLVIRLRGPRARLSRLVRQPGLVACLVVSACLVFFGVVLGGNIVAGRDVMVIQEIISTGTGSRSSGTSMPLWPLAIPTYGDRVGFAVAGAWLTQAVLGCWRPERSWIDRLGRLVGSTWIIAALLIWIRTFLI